MANVVRISFKRTGQRQRLLRSYIRVARKPHWCDDCHEMIEPEEEYKGEVWVYPNRDRHAKRRTWLVVIKRHTKCPVDPDDEQRRFDEMIDKMEAAEAGNAHEVA